MKDAYTYFVVSDDAEILQIEKLHFCSWLYRKPFFARILCGLWKPREVLEVGFQIRVTEKEDHELPVEKGHKILKLSLIIPWLKQGKDVVDMYPRISDTKNARFLFNEDVNPGDAFDGGERKTGLILKFDGGRPICVLPVSDVKACEGELDLDVKIPKMARLKDYPLYVRIAMKMPHAKYCCKNSCVTKSIYLYDVKVNEPRNYPDPEGRDRICDVKTCYCIHIVPSNFQISFTVAKAFRNVRILEHERYNDYVRGMKLFKENTEANQYQVIFNKIDREKDAVPFSFFSVMEKEHIGRSSVLIAILINILCTLLFVNKQDLKQSILCRFFAREEVPQTTLPKGGGGYDGVNVN